MFTPIAANTIANSPSAAVFSSSPRRSFSAFPSSSCLTRPACRQICAAMSLCGSPAALNSGIFCPRAMLFMMSMVEIPVWIISSGYVRSAGLMDAPLISRYFSASTGGPPSIGFPLPLKMRPIMSSDTGVFNTSPVNSREVALVSMPVVPSNTCTTALVPSTSSTCPRRISPSPSFKFTISANIGFLTCSTMTSGPLTPPTVL
mmetsp:Transcript_17838/g.53744  ORF Transcript_17838/g.53744 Transcript_17838/m.53744 type:complete len:203 (+) Transcript_17838:5043-5651(+)